MRGLGRHGADIAAAKRTGAERRPATPFHRARCAADLSIGIVAPLLRQAQHIFSQPVRRAFGAERGRAGVAAVAIKLRLGRAVRQAEPGEPQHEIAVRGAAEIQRELAREAEERERAIAITAKDAELRRAEVQQALSVEVEERNRRPIEAPVLAIYSRSDAVVAWQACIDRSSRNVEHVEVETTHVGLGFSPEVFELVARRLAALANGVEWRARDSA